MNKAYIALGTNIEPKNVHLSEALDLLEAHEAISIQKRSSIYQTAPVGYLDQEDFLNMVIEIQTLLEPFELLKFCQHIEEKLGREREVRFGPRTIDLDILLYNQEYSEEEELTIPHPRMHERAFVLIPLLEIEVNVALPGSEKTASDFLDELMDEDKESVVKWESN